jgi:hypothetical protein
VEDECEETPEEIARKFNGTCKRLGPGSAASVYWGSGGYLLGVVSLVIFGVTQATRIISDWWIRWAAAGGVSWVARMHVWVWMFQHAGVSGFMNCWWVHS